MQDKEAGKKNIKMKVRCGYSKNIYLKAYLYHHNQNITHSTTNVHCHLCSYKV